MQMKPQRKSRDSDRLYVAVDIGGTNIVAALVAESGIILRSEKTLTPRGDDSCAVVATIEKTINDVMEKAGVDTDDLAAVGVAVPGVVDPKTGHVAVTPNLCLGGVSLGPLLQERLKIPVTLGNDGNLGALGESWLGSARKSKSTLYICVGTGIGAGLVLREKLWRGRRETAGEIGHTIMQIGGPKCGCGNLGCLETLASRTAVERMIRDGIAGGRTSLVTELAGGDLAVIRSGTLRKALEAADELASEAVRRAAEVLGYACLNVRHLLDPDAIVLGGGMVEACADFIMPVVQRIVGDDPLVGVRESRGILLSALGDDAVLLGAVAAARIKAGRNPFKKRYRAAPAYPQIGSCKNGTLTVDDKQYDGGVYITVNGKTKKPQDVPAQIDQGSPRTIGTRELEIACRGGPEILFIGAGGNAQVELDEHSQEFLHLRSISVKILPARKAAESYNKSKRRRAALMYPII
jgi:glucokinase